MCEKITRVRFARCRYLPGKGAPERHWPCDRGETPGILPNSTPVLNSCSHLARNIRAVSRNSGRQDRGTWTKAQVDKVIVIEIPQSYCRENEWWCVRDWTHTTYTTHASQAERC